MKAMKKHKGALIALGIFTFVGLMFVCNITAIGTPCIGDPNECPGWEVYSPVCCCCSEINECYSLTCCCDESCYECYGGCYYLPNGQCLCVALECVD